MNFRQPKNETSLAIQIKHADMNTEVVRTAHDNFPAKFISLKFQDHC